MFELPQLFQFISNIPNPTEEFVKKCEDVRLLITKGIENISKKAVTCFENIQATSTSVPDVLEIVIDKTSNVVAQAISSCVLPALVTTKGEEFEQLRQSALATLQQWRNLGIHAYNSTIDISPYVSIDCLKLLQPTISTNKKWIFRFFGNNQSWESNLTDLLRLHNSASANVIAPNYRGVGVSNNFPKKEEDIIEDYVQLIKDVMKEYQIANDKIYLYGFDFGGYIAVRTAVRLQEDGIIVNIVSENSFSSYREVLDDKIPLYPLSHFTSDIFSNNGWPLDVRKDLPKLKGRLIVLYNNDDEVFGTSSHFRKAIQELQNIHKLYGTKILEAEELFEIKMSEKQFRQELQYMPQDYLIHTRTLGKREMHDLVKAINRHSKKSILAQ